MADHPFYVKDPDALLDYTENWATWLGTDEIDTSSWTVPAGITNAADSATTTTTTIWLSGGTAGTNYEVVNSITTTAGRETDRTLYIYVREK